MNDNGAHFYRCDFQVHTPRDSNWVGATCDTEEERQDYARRLVIACRHRGLQAIAITDHHDMYFVEFVRAAAADERNAEGNPLPADQRLIVFPGMELTLGVPCQALLIFDAELPTDLFPLAMTALAITPAAPDAPKTAPTQRLAHIESLKELKTELDKYAYLRNRYIVFPNVTNEGQFSILRHGLAGKYIEMPCVGGYVDGDATRLRAGVQNILSGRDPNWGNKRIAYFQTSDSRREDHQNLGSTSTWVKWATPTAEALRQACLAQESRVSQTPPRFPVVTIGSISVSNSAFLGPINLSFSPQYSTLIGGRGTGKSTILEYLRWALCDQPPTGGDEDTPSYQSRRTRLIEQTLKPFKATVEVTFIVNGVSHVVRRSSDDGSLLLKVANDEMRTCTEDEVRAILPIQAYSQKQLSDVSVRVDELLRFLNAPIRADLVRINGQLSDKGAKIREQYAIWRRQRLLSQAVQTGELEERSLAEQLNALRSSLLGLSSSDRELLEEEKQFSDADRIVRGWRDRIEALSGEASRIQQMAAGYLREIVELPTPTASDTLGAVQGEYRAWLTDAAGALSDLVARANTIGSDNISLQAPTPWAQWAAARAEFTRSYEQAAERSSLYADQLAAIQDIEGQLATRVRETRRTRDELATLATAEENYRAARQAWLDLLAEQNALLSVQCIALTDSSGGAIRARLLTNVNSRLFLDAIQQAFKGARITEAKVDAIGSYIANGGEEGVTRWQSIVGDLEKLAHFELDRDGAAKRPEVQALLAAGFGPAEVERVARTLQPDSWLTVALIPITSEPVFEYRARENDYIPFRNASAGQQATALLKTLLNQSGPPLLIDQPEEDLDNPVILEVVQQVWQAKTTRQLIFTSHNANLVVNGDAELVAWCEHRTASDQSTGEIRCEGAIDVPEVRDAIKRIMEGGEAAFNLRREKYGF